MQLISRRRRSVRVVLKHAYILYYIIRRRLLAISEAKLTRSAFENVYVNGARIRHVSPLKRYTPTLVFINIIIIKVRASGSRRLVNDVSTGNVCVSNGAAGRS